MTKLFVYGTLKKGFCNHSLLMGSKFLGSCTTEFPRFRMISLGAFCPAVIVGKNFIQGEVYEVDDIVLAAVDSLEVMYYRDIVAIFPFKDAFIYIMGTGESNWNVCALIDPQPGVHTVENVQWWVGHGD